MTKVLDLFTLKIRLENLGLILNLGQQKNRNQLCRCGWQC